MLNRIMSRCAKYGTIWTSINEDMAHTQNRYCTHKSIITHTNPLLHTLLCGLDCVCNNVYLSNGLNLFYNNEGNAANVLPDEIIRM